MQIHKGATDSFPMHCAACCPGWVAASLFLEFRWTVPWNLCFCVFFTFASSGLQFLAPSAPGDSATRPAHAQGRSGAAWPPPCARCTLCLSLSPLLAHVSRFLRLSTAPHHDAIEKNSPRYPGSGHIFTLTETHYNCVIFDYKYAAVFRHHVCAVRNKSQSQLQHELNMKVMQFVKKLFMDRVTLVSGQVCLL